MKKKQRKIGFITDDDFPEEQAEPQPDTLKDTIEMLYKPNGFNENKDFRTAAEIAYELSEMMEVSTKDVARTMTELGFQVTTVDNQVCFVVFSKPEEET